MWLNPGRMLCNSVQPEPPQAGTVVRGAADRVRAARRGGKDVAWTELSHPLRAWRAGGGRVFRDAHARRFPAADGHGAAGGAAGHPRFRSCAERATARSQSRLCGVATGAGSVASEAGGAQEEETHRSGAAHDARAGGGGHACTAALARSGPVHGAGRIRHQLSVAVTIGL